MRLFLVVLAMLLASYAVVVWQRNETSEATRAATLLEMEALLEQAIQRADRTAGRANRILSPLPVMTPGEENALRQFRNAAHVAQARAVGVRVPTREVSDSLLDVGRLVQLEDSTEHWIVRRGRSSARVVPELRALLQVIGARFQDRLAELGLPPYRIEVTSALRTSAGQARLRRTNANAAAGVSSHEFGATVDISYAAFAPPLEVPGDILTDVPPEFAPHMERFVDLAFESVSARKSRELGAIMSQVLAKAQADGLALVIYERQQTVYHVTVANTDLVSVD